MISPFLMRLKNKNKKQAGVGRRRKRQRLPNLKNDGWLVEMRER